MTAHDLPCEFETIEEFRAIVSAMTPEAVMQLSLTLQNVSRQHRSQAERTRRKSELRASL